MFYNYNYSVDRSRARIDLSPKRLVEILPRGVTHRAQYNAFNPGMGRFVEVNEYHYETAFGMANVVVLEGNSLEAGLKLAERLLKNNRQPMVIEDKARGVVNSVKNYEDLFSGSPLNLAICRAGCYTETDENKLLDIITGKRIMRSKLHRQMVSRPGLVFSYHPYQAEGYVRLKPGYVPPEVKLKYVTPLGTKHNEILYAGNLLNARKPEMVQRMRQDADYMLWLTEGEKKAHCLSLVPLLTGAKMDVLGIPGVWMWGAKQEGDWDLAPELSAYRFVDRAQHRIVGILFDQDSWRNPRVADALLRLCGTLRKQGALVVVGVILGVFHLKQQRQGRPRWE